MANAERYLSHDIKHAKESMQIKKNPLINICDTSRNMNKEQQNKFVQSKRTLAKQIKNWVRNKMMIEITCFGYKFVLCLFENCHIYACFTNI